MAFCGKLSGLLRQSISGSSISNGSAGPAMHLINSVRYMSSSKLFVGGLSWGTDDHQLKEAFSSFGTVTEARVITDRETGRSRGFGFVVFDSEESSTSAQSGMDGQELDGRSIRVNFANYGGGGNGDSFRSNSNYGGGGNGGSFRSNSNYGGGY